MSDSWNMMTEDEKRWVEVAGRWSEFAMVKGNGIETIRSSIEVLTLLSPLLHCIPKQIIQFSLMPFLKCDCSRSFAIGPSPCGAIDGCSLQQCCINKFSQNKYKRLDYSIVEGYGLCAQHYKAHLARVPIDYAAILCKEREQYFKHSSQPTSWWNTPEPVTLDVLMEEIDLSVSPEKRKKRKYFQSLNYKISF